MGCEPPLGSALREKQECRFHAKGSSHARLGGGAWRSSWASVQGTAGAPGSLQAVATAGCALGSSLPPTAVADGFLVEEAEGVG
jgi:hypothetical protein